MDKQKLQPLKGFRDFLPTDARKRNYALAIIRETFEQFGFEPLETPALEYKELLTGKYGDEADKLIYSFKDRGDRDVAMRYDQTVPTARILAMYNQELALPWRRYQIQPVWRAENPQKGRFREFLQCDGDIFGSTSTLADAEVIALSSGIYKNLGFSDISIFLNDRSILFDIMTFVSIPKDLHFSVIQSIDKLDRRSQDEVAAELITKGLDETTIKHLFNHLETAKPTTRLAEVLAHAETLGVDKDHLKFLPGLARGLDYYTSTIFEIKIKGYGAGSVLGGGRYDNLIEQLSGVSIPAIGFAVGFDRTIGAMEQFDLFPKSRSVTAALVTVFSPETLSQSTALVANLRENGIHVEIYPDDNVKLEKQLKYADKKGIKWLIVIGPEEVEKNTVILKDLATGHQEDVKLSEIVTKLKNL